MIGKNHLCAGMTAISEHGEALQRLPVPIHENGILKRTHSQRPALPRWWRQAGIRTLGCLLHCRFPSRSRQCVGSRRATFRSHHRCGTAPELHRLPV